VVIQVVGGTSYADRSGFRVPMREEMVSETKKGRGCSGKGRKRSRKYD
jgi:hypothetical protein